MKPKAFTILEMLVCLAVLAVVLALLLPSLVGAFDSGRRTRCVANLRDVHLSILQHVEETRRAPAVPFDAYGITGGVLHCPSDRVGGISYDHPTGHAVLPYVTLTKDPLPPMTPVPFRLTQDNMPRHSTGTGPARNVVFGDGQIKLMPEPVATNDGGDGPE